MNKLLLKYVECVAANSTKVRPEDLRKKSRLKEVVFARWIVWDFLHNYGYSYPNIAKIYGYKTHTAILHGVKYLNYKQSGWRKESKKYFDEKINEISNDMFLLKKHNLL